MPKERKKNALEELESTQAALRKDIEDSKELIARSEQLLDRHRAETQQQRSEPA